MVFSLALENVFLTVAAIAVPDSNKQRNENGLTFARRATIRCGFAKRTNRVWETKQLYVYPFANITAKHRMNFDFGYPGAFQSVYRTFCLLT